MKKTILSIALGLIAMLSVSASFAAGKSTSTATQGTIVEHRHSTVAYDAKGNWVYTIHRYTSDNLPKDVFNLVRGDYNNYYVNGIEKIEQPGSDPVYLVYLENNNSYKTVRVDSDDNTELVQDFKKS